MFYPAREVPMDCSHQLSGQHRWAVSWKILRIKSRQATRWLRCYIDCGKLGGDCSSLHPHPLLPRQVDDVPRPRRARHLQHRRLGRRHQKKCEAGNEPDCARAVQLPKVFAEWHRAVEACNPCWLDHLHTCMPANSQHRLYRTECLGLWLVFVHIWIADITTWLIGWGTIDSCASSLSAVMREVEVIDSFYSMLSKVYSYDIHGVFVRYPRCIPMISKVYSYDMLW